MPSARSTVGLGSDVGVRAYLPVPPRAYTPDNRPADLDQSPELKRLHEAHRARQEKFNAGGVLKPAPLTSPAPPSAPPPPPLFETVIIEGFWGYHRLGNWGRKSAAQIIGEVARTFHVSPQNMKGPRRFPLFVEARQHAMWRVRNECPHLSFPQIGTIFGGKDHTTVLHACQKIDRLIKQGKYKHAPLYGGKETGQ